MEPEMRAALFDLIDMPLQPGTHHQRQMEVLLRHFQRNGHTLMDCTHPQRLGRKLRTLQQYARRLKLKFPDYPKQRAKKEQGQ